MRRDDKCNNVEQIDLIERMRRAIMKRRENNNPYYLYNENTEPALVSITQPIPPSAYKPQRPSWFTRTIYAIGNFFAHWVFLLSTPLVAPFEHLVPALPYNGYIIDISTLISIVAYTIGVTIVRQFLKLLITR